MQIKNLYSELKTEEIRSLEHDKYDLNNPLEIELKSQ